MSKRISAVTLLILGACMLVSCGNKGELFLPADAAIAMELDAVSERVRKEVDGPADDEVADEQKRRRNQALEQTPE